jgi:predicted N-acetyltransferase YhbS
MTAGADSAAELLQLVVREETPDDIEPIDVLTRAAFRDHPFSRQTEHLILRGLREAGALPLSLVATLEGGVVGHVAFSPVTIGAQDPAWCGLGPVSVMPAHQRSGIGSALIRSDLRRLRERGVVGCVVLGDPGYYGRFGFAPHAGLVYPGPPASYFIALALEGAVPIGEVKYHPAFSRSGP